MKLDFTRVDIDASVNLSRTILRNPMAKVSDSSCHKDLVAFLKGFCEFDLRREYTHLNGNRAEPTRRLGNNIRENVEIYVMVALLAIIRCCILRQAASKGRDENILEG